MLTTVNHNNVVMCDTHTEWLKHWLLNTADGVDLHSFRGAHSNSVSTFLTHNQMAFLGNCYRWRLSNNLHAGFPSRPPQEWRHDLNFGYIHFLGGCRYNCQVVGTNLMWSKRNLILALKLLKRTDLAVDCLMSRFHHEWVLTDTKSSVTTRYNTCKKLHISPATAVFIFSSWCNLTGSIKKPISIYQPICRNTSATPTCMLPALLLHQYFSSTTVVQYYCYSIRHQASPTGCPTLY